MHNRFFAYFLLVLLFFISNQNVVAQTRFSEYSAHHHNNMPYRLYQPVEIEVGETYPLVLFFHGAGSRGSDNELHLTHFGNKIPKSQYNCFVLAPQCAKDTKWVDTDWTASSHQIPSEPSAALCTALAILDSLIEVLPIDESRIYVTGLSMGGFATWDLIARYPKKFAAAVAVCGGADLKTAGQITHLPIWIFHGALDRVVNVNRSRDMAKALEKAGAKQFFYSELPDVYHNAWEYAYSLEAMYAWLFAQKKP
ncbi:MAG: prolyl oligopeptidase family serine peptidase [Bernardetiaceae bacterium]|nr:prolyl oligopeptidase family serine peptidase [Bernardetiaceae bacterium]